VQYQIKFQNLHTLTFKIRV